MAYFYMIFLALVLLMDHGSSFQSSCNDIDTTKDKILSNFLKFGIVNGDKELKNDDDHEILIKIPLSFPFFGEIYQQFYLSINGVCQLLKNNNKKFTLYPYPRQFPLFNQTIIAPFWSDINTYSFGEVFYRQTTDLKTLDRISCDISQSYSAFLDYKPSWAYVITWFEVQAHGYSSNNNPGNSYKNTFQLIISTDGVYSFLIYNYGTMEWPNNFVNKSALFGFNSGNYKDFYSNQESFTTNIRNLDNTSNVDIPGRWIFRTDQSEVVPKNFLRFGTKANDHLLKKSDDGYSDPIAVRNIEFLNLNISTIFIYTNGFITLNSKFTYSNQLPDDSNNFNIDLGENYIIAPLWSDVNSINGGDIFYRHVLDTESLIQISNEIHLLNGNDSKEKIEFTWAFVVTWYCVEPHGWTDFKNTFQLVIAANLDYSFMIFNYGDLTWPNRQVEKNIHAGYYFGSLNKMFNFNLSMMSNVATLSQQSNCNVKGKYLLRLNHSEYLTTTTTTPQKLSTTTSISDESKKGTEYEHLWKWMYIIIFFLVIIGINSAVNSCQWVFQALKKHEERQRFSYQARYNDVSGMNNSELMLNRFEEQPCI